MRGDVTTGGLDTTYYFQYAPDSEQFCTSEGASGTPSSSAMQILPAGFGRANVGVEVYGLASGSSYCYRLFTTNSDGTAYGGVDTFTYVLPPPGVPSTGLTTTGASTATMVGRVSPNGQATAVEVVYDVAGSEFCTNQSSTDPAFHTPPVGIAADVVASQVVSLILSGLTPGTQYCAGLLATNPSGATLVRVNPFTAGVPVVEPLGVVAVGRTAATVSGTVDPVAQPTTYAVAYDLASSPWCRSNGSLGKPSFLAGGGALRFTDVRSHNVTAEVTGLAPRISYCLVLMARNGSGAAFAGTPTPLLAKCFFT